MLKIITINDKNYYFNCESKPTRTGFCHIVELFEETEFGPASLTKARVNYYNRTWESYEFRTAMTRAVSDCIDNYRACHKSAFMDCHGYKRMTAEREKEFNCYIALDNTYNEYYELYCALIRA